MVRRPGAFPRPEIGRTLRRMLICWTFDVWIYSVVVYSRMHQQPANKEQPYASIVYTAVEGGKAALPCDISAPTPGDSATLVLWYKDENIAPIFTLDSRHRRLDHVRRSLPEDFQRRLLFDMGHSPARLQIDSVLESDAGEYRCRVDFRQARSVNTVIKLKVIVPPGNPVIMDEEGRKLGSKVVRFNEGQKLRLLCEVEGGKPRPVVTWWRDKVLLDSDFSFVGDGSVAHNWLDIDELKRSDYLSVLTCQAASNNGTVAVSRSVSLDMNLVPLDVAIQPPRQPLSAGKLAHLVCLSSGSRPPAVLTWWKGGEQLLSAQEQTRNYDDSASSVLHFTPRQEDNGAILSCRAENKLIPGSDIEHGKKLDVLYKPKVLLRLGQNLQEDGIREGGDVYLECEVDANPSAIEVTWLFESHEITTNASAGVIVSSRSLVLQKVHRSSRGRYTCVAMNPEGRSTSNILVLRIKYAPVCKHNQKRMYGASQNDSVLVPCEVDADPGDVTFYWRFDSTVSGKRLAMTGFSQEKTRSVASYTASKEDDFGLLLCWGANEIGRQEKPCTFAVVKTGPPEPVRNCSQDNGTSNSVSFECLPGVWDGGIVPVSFVAELREVDTNRLVANASTTSRPAFSFNGLEEGATFRVVLYSTNPKGHRAPVAFFVSTYRSAETVSPAEEADLGNTGHITGALLGATATLGIAAGLMGLIIRNKRFPRKKGTALPGECKEHDVEMSNSFETRKYGFLDPEHKTPDIIPASLGCQSTQEPPSIKQEHANLVTMALPVVYSDGPGFRKESKRAEKSKTADASVLNQRGSHQAATTASTLSVRRPEEPARDTLLVETAVEGNSFLHKTILKCQAQAHGSLHRSSSDHDDVTAVISSEAMESSV